MTNPGLSAGESCVRKISFVGRFGLVFMVTAETDVRLYLVRSLGIKGRLELGSVPRGSTAGQKHPEADPCGSLLTRAPSLSLLSPICIFTFESQPATHWLCICGQVAYCHLPLTWLQDWGEGAGAWGAGE